MLKVAVSIFILLAGINCAKADILYQDNLSDSFGQEYSSYNYYQLIDKGSKRTPREEYFLAFAYLINENNVLKETNVCKAFHGFESASKSGIVDATFNVAIMYYNGQCVERNLDKTRSFLTRAAEQQYVQAQALLGRAYWGEDVEDLYETDNAAARKWLEKAANNGDAPSAIGLSYLYEHALGGSENPELAFKWRLKASSLPYGEFAMGYFLPLARYYENGYGTEVDLIQAYKYYDLSGSVGGAGLSRVSKKMTSEQIADARQQSRHWQEENRRFNPGYNGLQRQSDGSYR
ncbi:tetratricopeptide repeat protein [Cobetia sp. 10Alg 146]|uniref:tetratricopeptide repeat protein n=1 Tax=unclassified Cobetia TaxID=2609414 RepID=UPI001596AA47|nr:MULTISPECIES: tetratricopeptide repeat protein [unclassified Cobetia]MDH2291465.1 tetratricopeptide repeat protein [Cobetia sp. 10Alg 146]